MGDARAVAVRWCRFVVLEVGVLVYSTSEESGVVGRLVAALKAGRRREVSEGEGGSGTGGRL